MADLENAEITFLQDLPAHASPKGSDLLLVNTDGIDKSLTLDKLAEYTGTVDAIYPVGVVMWFAQNKNPNDLFPGTTWNYLGENRTIRLGKADGSDVRTTGGADSVTLSAANLPAHNHTFSASTSSFDHGTKTTNSAGAHTHGMTVYYLNTSNQVGRVGAGGGDAGTVGTQATASAGAHTHTVGIGAHSHTVSGTTANSGSGTAFTVTNSFIKLMGWYRSA